jgi:GST-like protein
VMDKELSKKAFIAGKDYSIADIAIFPWTRSWKNQGLTLEEFPNVLRWHQEIAARPAVQRGVEVLTSLRKPLIDDKARENLYGKTQYQQR